MYYDIIINVPVRTELSWFFNRIPELWLYSKWLLWYILFWPVDMKKNSKAFNIFFVVLIWNVQIIFGFTLSPFGVQWF